LNNYKELWRIIIRNYGGFWEIMFLICYFPHYDKIPDINNWREAGKKINKIRIIIVLSSLFLFINQRHLWTKECIYLTIVFQSFRIQDKTANKNIKCVHSDEIKYSNYIQTPQYFFMSSILFKGKYIVELEDQQK
jgi:hypothetical protein